MVRQSTTCAPENAIDYTRQLNVWDDDLRPSQDDPARWYVYFVEATNLLLMAIAHDDDEGLYGTPKRSVAAARSAVCSYQAMHRDGDDREADLRQLVGAVEARLVR